jgi:cyclic pyranopterin phosphate synthase
MLSHVDSSNRPTMVDIGAKAVTRRTAVATAEVVFPENVLAESGGELRTKKGPVFDTAIIAGVMAAKRTHELIPFCHAIALESCKIEIEWGGPGRLLIECSVEATHKTGVEMEALTGAATAALTVYDMCKALTHGIVIRHLGLRSKSGGKRDFDVSASQSSSP